MATITAYLNTTLLMEQPQIWSLLWIYWVTPIEMDWFLSLDIDSTKCMTIIKLKSIRCLN